MERMFIYFVLAALSLLVLACIASTIHYALRTYLQFRGKRLVVCPEAGKYVAVEVDAARAATTVEPELRLRSCTRWPERADCDQACVWQIEHAPEDCLVRTMANSWYEGRACVFCGRPIGEINWHEHAPALMAPDRHTVAWDEVAPEQLPEVFQTHLPVCWNCHVAESFRGAHPNLVVERPWVH